MQHHACQDGHRHRREDHLEARQLRYLIRHNSTRMIDARPRGPNQPMNKTELARRPMPAVASATGSILTSVRLSAAYSAMRQFASWRNSSDATPKMKKMAKLSSWPSSSVNAKTCFAHTAPISTGGQPAYEGNEAVAASLIGEQECEHRKREHGELLEDVGHQTPLRGSLHDPRAGTADRVREQQQREGELYDVEGVP